jgi:dTDP-4-dehydrorhamnose reductase
VTGFGLKRLLVTGASGQVGGELVHTLGQFGTVIAPSREEMNLASATSVRSFLRDAKPDWIVSAGAYTAVDKAESEPELAYAINAEAVGVLGEEAKALGATVLHFSTDYVFNGEGSTAWVESDPTGPLGVYGASKLAGEQALRLSGATALIFRTSWVYGATGKNFLRTILKLARERAELRIVDDQHGAPTWSRDLAKMTAHIIAHCGNSPHAALPFAGIYHAAGAGETTWAGFARAAIHRLQQREPTTSFASISGIPTSGFPTPAARPHNSRLNCSKLSGAFHWAMMDWEESLEQVLAELEQGYPSALPGELSPANRLL